MHYVLAFALLLPSLRLLAQGEVAADRLPEMPPDRIELQTSNTDTAITQGLAEIFRQIDNMSGIQATAAAGVVELSGTVPDAATVKAAEDITYQMEDVVYVVNELEPEVNVASRLNPAIHKARELSREALRKLPILLIALLVIAFFWIAGGWLSRRKTWARLIGMDELSANLLQRFIKLVMTGLGIFIALEILDATALAGAILGVAGVAGIALGFAFRNIVENYLAGILLSLRNPFTTGDAVAIEGVTGKVIRLTSRDTVLMTFEGNHLRIPNSKIMTSTMTNFTRNPLRRFDFAIGVSVELDILEVRKLAMQTLNTLPSVLDEPAPKIIIEELGDSTINMRFYAWIDQRKSDYLKSKSEAIRLVKDTFDSAGVEMPEPIYRVHLREAGKPGQGPTEQEVQVPPQIQAQPQKKTPSGYRDKTSDTSVDYSIDNQLKTAQAIDDEPNLLETLSK